MTIWQSVMLSGWDRFMSFLGLTVGVVSEQHGQRRDDVLHTTAILLM